MCFIHMRVDGEKWRRKPLNMSLNLSFCAGQPGFLELQGLKSWKKKTKSLPFAKSAKGWGTPAYTPCRTGGPPASWSVWPNKFGIQASPSRFYEELATESIVMSEGIRIRYYTLSENTGFAPAASLVRMVITSAARHSFGSRRATMRTTERLRGYCCLMNSKH